MTFLLSLLVVILATTGMSNPLSHSDGDSNTDNAIANLTAAINQLLTQSSHSCPVSCRSGSRDSLTDLMQLVLTRQLLTASTPDTCVVDKELKSLIKQLTSTVETQSKQIKKISSQLDHLNRALHNTTGPLAYEEDDEGEDPSSPLLHSCEEIKSKWPSSPSDYYIIADSHGHARHVYCYMEELCSSAGGWMRVAYLNVTDSSEKCPDGFRLYSENGVRACGRPVSSGGSCVGITFPSGNVEYSQVCGKVIGYSIASPDGPVGSDINGNYIDGISLTHGSPRKHIWSLIATARGNAHPSECPCGTSGPKSAPLFVSTDYYCESGNPNSQWQGGKFYSADPLWDGKGCGSVEGPCCNRPNLPWFYKSLGYTTTDSIEMRLCCDEGTTNEDVSFGLVEIYFK